MLVLTEQPLNSEAAATLQLDRLHSAPATLVSSVAARSRKLAEGLPQQNDLADTVRKKNQCLEEVLHLALATVSSSLANSSTVPCNLSWVGCCCSRGKRE